MKRYYWLEFLNADGEWEIENGYMSRAEAMEDKQHLVGSYAEWTPRQELRTKDVRIREEKQERKGLEFNATE